MAELVIKKKHDVMDDGSNIAEQITAGSFSVNNFDI